MVSKMVGTPKMIVSFEWILENVREEPMMIASKMILFRGEKVFRVGLKNLAKSPILFFMAIELNKIGMEVEDVTYGIQGSGTSPETMMEIKREKEIGINGSLQLFKTPLEKKVVGNCTFVFRICIKGTYGYSYQLCDRLAKDQLWAAFKNHQHLADVVLIVKDKTFPAHKSILAARSKVFADEFEKVQPAVKDVPHLQIRIDDVEPATVEKFLHFIYTGEPMGTLADEELLKLSHHYQLKTLTGLCQVALSKIETTQMTKFMASLYSGSDALSSSRIM
jgi:speckle-type POZ protein